MIPQSRKKINRGREKRKNGKKKEWDGKGKEKEKGNRKSSSNSGCFICNGPHQAKKCPKHEKLGTIVGAEVGNENDKVDQVCVNFTYSFNDMCYIKQPLIGFLYVEMLVGKDNSVLAMLDTNVSTTL